MIYAGNTKVSVDTTVAQIRKLLEKHGASGFGYNVDHSTGKEEILFRVPSSSGVVMDIKYSLPVRSPNDYAITEKGNPRKSQDSIQQAYEQGTRALWRLAYVSIKAKLDGIRQGLSVIEREFFYDVVVPNTGGRTVGEVYVDEVETGYRLMPGRVITPQLPNGRGAGK